MEYTITLYNTLFVYIIMVEIPAKWVLEGYTQLWSKFKEKPFKSTEAKKVINGVQNPSNLYSHLKNTGWLKIERDPKDSRKSIYTLKDPKQTIEEIGKK